MFSVATALGHKDDINIAIVDYYIESNRRLFTQALESSEIFDTVVSFSDAHIKSKLKRRRARMRKLAELVAKVQPFRVYTGSDRNVGFQYTMYLANRGSSLVKGHYLDEGTQTYLGHGNMYSIVHNYVEPLLKKLVYGMWWSNPKMIGASKWVSTIHAALPNLVHSVIRNKNIEEISPTQFNHPAFSEFNEKLLSLADIEVKPLKNVRYVIILTGDSFYKDINKHLDRIVGVLTQNVEKKHIAVKAHPRSNCIEHFKQKHPELIHIDNRVGFEFLLPQFSSDCTFIGDISSTLFTIKWLNINKNVLAVKPEQDTLARRSDSLTKLLNEVGVKQLSYQEFEQEISKKTNK